MVGTGISNPNPKHEVTHNYYDYRLVGSVLIVTGVHIGLDFSPAVSSEKKYVYTYDYGYRESDKEENKGKKDKTGHGRITKIAARYSLDMFSIESGLKQEAENKNSDSAEKSSSWILGEVLLGPIFTNLKYENVKGKEYKIGQKGGIKISVLCKQTRKPQLTY